MFKAIVTKYHGPGNVRGSRYSASAEGVGTIYLPASYELNSEENHALAAETLCKKYNWTGELIGGGMPDSRGNVWVFADSPMRANKGESK